MTNAARDGMAAEAIQPLRTMNCYVLVDLKRDKLMHKNLGQRQMYVNYFDRHVKLSDELPTIGILLCHRKNDALVELTLPPDSHSRAGDKGLKHDAPC